MDDPGQNLGYDTRDQTFRI